jgi:hypothetical protein
MHTKKSFVADFFCLLPVLPAGTFTSVFKDNKALGSQKTEEIMDVFLVEVKERPGRPKTYGSYGSGSETLVGTQIIIPIIFNKRWQSSLVRRNA